MPGRSSDVLAVRAAGAPARHLHIPKREKCLRTALMTSPEMQHRYGEPAERIPHAKCQTSRAMSHGAASACPHVAFNRRGDKAARPPSSRDRGCGVNSASASEQRCAAPPPAWRRLSAFSPRRRRIPTMPSGRSPSGGVETAASAEDPPAKRRARRRLMAMRWSIAPRVCGRVEGRSPSAMGYTGRYTPPCYRYPVPAFSGRRPF